MIGDFHIHSRYSHDSIMSPRLILKLAKKNKMDTIAITDHDTIRGAKVAKGFEEEYGVNVIIGSEVKTDIGDIIGLGLTEEIASRAWSDVIHEIRDQGGISVLPHPFRSHVLIQEVADRVDIIEIWNARSTKEQNRLAESLCVQKSKCSIMGSDAHTPSEIGNVIIEVANDYRGANRVIKTTAASLRQIRTSQIISLIRKLYK